MSSRGRALSFFSFILIFIHSFIHSCCRIKWNFPGFQSTVWRTTYKHQHSVGLSGVLSGSLSCCIQVQPSHRTLRFILWIFHFPKTLRHSLLHIKPYKKRLCLCPPHLDRISISQLWASVSSRKCACTQEMCMCADVNPAWTRVPEQAFHTYTRTQIDRASLIFQS